MPMPRVPFLLCLLLLAATSAGRAGTLTGTIRAEPPSEPNAAAASNAYSSHRYKFAEKIDYEHLQDFVVYIDQPVPGGPLPGQPLAVTTQKDANFDPHVLPVAVGTTVRWPNEDDIYHNVFSMSESKSFDLDYYKKERVPEVVFDHVGRVDVFCAIHTRMHCIILVLPNAYFATADAHGHYIIRNIPAGTYHVRGWHERFPGQVRDIVIPADGEVRANFVLGVANLPRPSPTP